MKKMSMVFLAWLSVGTAMAQDNGGIDWKQFNTMDEALALSRQTGKPLFVYFTAAWCGPCKKAQAEYFSQPTENELVRKEFISIKIDIDKDSVLYSQAVKEFGYQESGKISVPTFQLVYPDVNYWHKFSGYSTAAGFKEAIAFPAVMMAYQKSKDKAALLDELQDESTLKQFIKLCIDEDADEYSRLLVGMLKDVVHVRNAREVLGSNEFKRFFFKKYYLVDRAHSDQMHKLLTSFKTQLDESLYVDYLSLFYPDKDFFGTLVSRFTELYGDKTRTSEEAVAYYRVRNWMKQAVFTHRYFSEKDVLDFGAQFGSRELLAQILLESKWDYHYGRKEEAEWKKYFIELFDTYETGPGGMLAPQSGAYNLNFFAWYMVFENPDADAELLKKGMQMSVRSLALYTEAEPQKKKLIEFQNYVDTYIKLYKRIKADPRIDNGYADTTLKQDEATLFPLLDEEYKTGYQSIKEKLLAEN